MITQGELRTKTEKLFYKLVTSQLKGETIFPYTIPSNKQISGTNYSEWKNDIVPLYNNSKKVKGKGYSIELKDKKINGSTQSVPVKIYFESFEDYLFYVNKTEDFNTIKQARTFIESNIPTLQTWCENNPALLLQHHSIWNDIIKVCKYFLNNQPPHQYYIRELPIEGLHSKFIEENAAIIKRLLDTLLPQHWITFTESDFALRYNLKKVNVYTQIRILDNELKIHLGYDECALTLDDAAWLKWLPKKVFIIENQICFYTFPPVKDAVAIFGEGFKSRLTKHLTWLENTELFCWFDTDAAGFEMLNMIRQHYPNCKSFLMDKNTYEIFEKFSVEPKAKFKPKQLQLLNDSESSLYNYLVENNRRLEQEKITHQYVSNRLYSLLS